MSQDRQQDTFVGYVNAPQTTINFSLTEQELNDLGFAILKDRL